MGWVCPACGTVRAPSVNACCKVAPTLGLDAFAASTPSGTASVDASASSGTASAEVVALGTKAKPPTTSTKRQYNDYNDPQFVEFWKAFPSTRGKATAYSRWQRLMAQGVDASAVIAGAKRYRLDPQRDPAKTKYAEGWLHDGRWQDYDETEEASHPLAAVGPDTFEEQRAARIAEEERAIYGAGL